MPSALTIAAELGELRADVREVIADIDRATNDGGYRDLQAIIECVRARLVELVGEPEPAREPDRITAVVPRQSATGGPFDTITITHPNGDTETLDVPERVDTAYLKGTRLGPARLHETLFAAGYRTVGEPLDLPDHGPHGVYVYTIERLSD